ncbi:MAG: glycosyl transferase family 2 [Alphaproteobacteria bacterium]|nr:glycosyl transferase family 2 [Alphaproteobacteria bacterium]
MKIAICVPIHGDVRGEWSVSLAKLIYHTARHSDHDLEVFFVESSSIASNRSELVLSAREWGAEAVLWTDADHTFPPDALLRLLAHDKPVVGVNYPRRMDPSLPTASIKNGNGYKSVYTTKAKAEASEMERVATLGLGLCLIRMTAFAQLRWPLFQQEMDGSRLRHGEDVFLFRKLETAGVPVFLDHGLSWHVGHIANHIVTNADTERLNEN